MYSLKEIARLKIAGLDSKRLDADTKINENTLFVSAHKLKGPTKVSYYIRFRLDRLF